MRALRRSGPEPTEKLQFQRTAGLRSRGQAEAASGHARGAKKPDSITEITRTISARGEHFHPGQAAFSESAATSFGKAPGTREMASHHLSLNHAKAGKGRDDPPGRPTTLHTSSHIKPDGPAVRPYHSNIRSEVRETASPSTLLQHFFEMLSRPGQTILSPKSVASSLGIW
jgi:hypothetical protein